MMKSTAQPHVHLSRNKVLGEVLIALRSSTVTSLLLLFWTEAPRVLLLLLSHRKNLQTHRQDRSGWTRERRRLNANKDEHDALKTSFNNRQGL